MKSLTGIATFFLVVFFFNSANAKIWRVNNTAGVVADFTTVQAAHDAATGGDTIHVEASASGYSGVTVTKQIVIIGDGYFLTTDTVLQANTNNSNVSTVTFNAGSANSVMEGLTINYVDIHTDHILIKRNYFGGTWQYLNAGANNCTFSGNYFASYGLYENSGPISNLYVGNNIFALVNITLGVDVAGTFENNTVWNGYTVSLYNFQVDNNIFASGTPFTANNVVPFNNIGNSTQFGNTNGNQQNVNMSTVFLLTGSLDAQFQLLAGSPAIGTGYQGVDCGAFGGPNPYKIGLIPSVPTIYKLTVPPVGTSTISVTVSTRSNN